MLTVVDLDLLSYGPLSSNLFLRLFLRARSGIGESEVEILVILSLYDFFKIGSRTTEKRHNCRHGSGYLSVCVWGGGGAGM
jgi:hypothetical protein